MSAERRDRSRRVKPTGDNPSFVAEAFDAIAALEGINLAKGKNVDAGVGEVKRQLHQAFSAGEPMTGRGAVNSGQED